MIDPRFDPRFQRGYTGEGDEPTAGAVSSARAGSGAAGGAGAAGSAANRIPEPPASVAPTAPAAESPPVGEGTVDGDGELEPPRRNPWLIALWVVSIAMIVVPTAVFRQALGEQRNAPWSDLGPPPEVIYMQLALQLVPALVLMGGIGVLLAIGVHAWGWSSRHRRAVA